MNKKGKGGGWGLRIAGVGAPRSWLKAEEERTHGGTSGTGVRLGRRLDSTCLRRSVRRNSRLQVSSLMRMGM